MSHSRRRSEEREEGEDGKRGANVISTAAQVRGGVGTTCSIIASGEPFKKAGAVSLPSQTFERCRTSGSIPMAQRMPDSGHPWGTPRRIEN
eukprot:6663764-Pyramimonas_sp.AAC.1